MGTTERIEEGPMRMLEQFAAICGAPDDEQLARQADQELAELDALMRG